MLPPPWASKLPPMAGLDIGKRTADGASITHDGEKRVVRPTTLAENERVPLASLQELLHILTHRGKEARDANPHVNSDFHVDISPDRLFAVLGHLENTGAVHLSCQKAGVSPRLYGILRKNIPELAKLHDEALERFRETLELEAVRRARIGWKEPVFGGKDKDRIVGHVRKFDSRLLELLLKRHFPEYREKFEGNIKITGGVLVVPTQQLDPSSWAQEHGGEKLRDLVDEPTPAQPLPPAPQPPPG